MHRIDADAHVNHLFSSGDPGAGQKGTKVSADWLNAVQEEICNLLEQLGVALNKASNTQLATALLTPVPRTALPLAAGATPEEGGNALPPKYSKSFGGVVRFEGSVSLAVNGSGSAAICAEGALPASCRPVGGYVVFAVPAGGVVYIYPTGEVTLWEASPGSNRNVCLDGISFYGGA